MYLCIGVLLDLISKFKRGRAYDATKSKKEKLISNEKICEYLFETCLLPEEMYIQQKISPIIKCNSKSHLKCNITNYFKNYDIYDEEDALFLHNELIGISNNILTKVINPNYIKAFIESLIIVIEHDDSISADMIVGMNPEYTRNNILSWKAFDAREFLANILYFTYIRPDNEKGADTLVALDFAFINERIHSLNFISLTNDKGDQRLTFKFLNKTIADDVNMLPHELTNTMVIRSSAQNVLFRENEYNQIIDDIKSKQLTNIFIHGMGGCGKTSLARMVYCHLKDQYDCCGWINYSGNIKQSMIADFAIDYSDETMIENDATKKWDLIKRKLRNSVQSKLLVIDNVDNIDSIQQYPKKDKALLDMSSWSNITIIITSRLPELPGYSTSYIVNNLGNAEDSKNCVELFYHYNPDAANERSKNDEIVKKLCALAGYNTMVIELLSKGSIYRYHSLETFYNELIKNNFSCANDTTVETDHDYTIIKTNTSDENYYDIGNETVASQIFKLFNLKTRTPLQQLILWDFHCLRENEKVSLEEINNWMGFKLKDISPLIKEGWIKQLDGYYFIHPLVNQSVSCSKETSENYWTIKKSMIDSGEYTSKIISSISENTFFNESDSFELSLRKLIFVDCLTYHGLFLTLYDWINLADFARRRGNISLGIYYYKKAHDYCTSVLSLTNIESIDPTLYWKCTYFYGYMLSYTKAGYENAEQLLKLSLEIAEGIVEEKGLTDDNVIILATSFDHLGYILSNSLNGDISRITRADCYLNEAVKLRQILCAFRPDHYRLLHDYAWSLDNLGSFYTNINIDKIIFTNNPDKSDMEYLTCDEIIINKKNAEKILKKSLEIRIALANARGDADSTEVAWTYFNLACLLYSSLSEMDTKDDSNYANYFLTPTIKQIKLWAAEEYINKALEIYHHLDKRFPGQHMGSEARTTALYGSVLKMFPERQNEAQIQFDKALMLYSYLNNEYPGRYEQEIQSLSKDTKIF